MDKKNGSISGAQSAGKVLKLLKIVGARHPHGVRLKEVIAESGQDRSTAHRLLACLVEEGFVQRSPIGKVYRLDMEAMQLGLGADGLAPMVERFRPVMKRLARSTGDTVFLVVRSGDHALCLHRIRRDFPLLGNGIKCQDWFWKSQSTTLGRRSPMSEITRVGVDLAKRVIQIHAVNAAGLRVTGRALPRDKFLAWCAQLPAGCLVAMEASSSAHHWSRKLLAMGLDARIIPSHLVTPYRLQGKSGKNDANDAAAICEAASRPQMHFVPIKSVEQQSMLCIHRLREGLKTERVACINRIRGLLAEFGLVFAQKPEVLRQALPDAIEDASNELGGLARMALQRAQQQWQELDGHLDWCDARIAAHLKASEQVRQAQQLMGVGPITASAVVATVGDFRQFKDGAQFGAWLGLTPRQNSSGGKNNLGKITKRGDIYLRTLLIQGAKSIVLTAHKRDDPISRWVQQLKEKSGWQKAVVALANKNARILWAVFVRGKSFDARHVSVKPTGATPVGSAMAQLTAIPA